MSEEILKEIEENSQKLLNLCKLSKRKLTEDKIKKIKKLLQQKIDVNVRDSCAYTPLHWAAWNGHIEVVMLLIENGADVHAVNNDKCSSLFGCSKWPYRNSEADDRGESRCTCWE
jgi:ankyrin repeat protein